jgi:hypothetical protein
MAQDGEDFIDVDLFTDDDTIERGGVDSEALESILKELRTDKQNIDVGTYGIALNDIQQSNRGKAKFELNGTPMAVTVEARGNIDQGQPVRVIGDENKVQSISTSEPSGKEAYPKTRVVKQKFGDTVESGSDIFSDDMEPTVDGSIFRVTISLSKSSKLLSVVGTTGSSSEDYFNQNRVLEKDSLYEFSFTVPKNTTINYRVEPDTGSEVEVKRIVVKEIVEGSQI